jgi:hypothetical protein
MFDVKRKFLFRCESCEAMVLVEFDEPEDLEKIQEDRLILECPCGDHSRVLWD